MMSPNAHYAANELICRSRHYQALVNDKGNSAEVIACEGAAFDEEALAAEALRTMHPGRFTKRDESAQMDKHHMQEQAHYLYARMSQGAKSADRTPRARAVLQSMSCKNSRCRRGSCCCSGQLLWVAQ